MRTIFKQPYINNPINARFLTQYGGELGSGAKRICKTAYVDLNNSCFQRKFLLAWHRGKTFCAVCETERQSTDVFTHFIYWNRYRAFDTDIGRNLAEASSLFSRFIFRDFFASPSFYIAIVHMKKGLNVYPLVHLNF